VGRLDGKVAIVTGAGRGIGRATALRLAADGAAVVVNDIDGEPAHETADLVKQAGGVASVSLADTVDLAAARELADSTVEQHGKLDILVNNAGITRDRMFHNLDDDLFDFVLDVNLKTAVHATQAAMPHMREVAKAEIKANGKVAYQRKIVNTSSSVAFTGNPGQANYTAAKGAIISLTRTLARELGPFGITVNAVAPGFVRTDMTLTGRGATDWQGMEKRFAALAMMNRIGEPEDIANAVLFLASPESGWITAQTLTVDGGRMDYIGHG
jgi:3-oxoacyl-[acyl-carrier protein] reductase